MKDVGEAVGLLGKLPPLDAEHAKAVGASMPGRLLGRTAALVAAFAALFGTYAVVQGLLPGFIAGLRETYPPFVFDAVFFGLPILIVAVQLALEWVQRRRTKRMQERLLRGEVRDPSYFRLTPYTVRNRAQFARADRAHERVREWIEDARDPILFLTGDSGTGKSSLLNAHVVPELSGHGWLVVAARSYADPLASLRAALTAPGAIWKNPPAEPDAYALLAQAAQRLARDGRRLCVVLDQFEEFVILLEAGARDAFAALLRRLAEEPVPGLRLVLVLRSEYEAALADAGLPRLRQGENWFKLGAFTEPAARKFLQDSGLDLAPETFDRLLKGAAAAETTRGLYRPIVLNLLGLILARPAVRLHEGFDPERAIQTHLRESVAAADVREDAAAILPRMITEAGTKRPAEEAALAAESRVPLARVRHCLLQLAEGGLVRPLGHEQVVWEIGHDFMATQLALLLGRLRLPLWRRALPYAVPALATLWVATAVLLSSWWPQRRLDAAVAALSAQGFTVLGSKAAGFRIHSADLEEGSIEAMGPFLRVIRPLSLVIVGDDRSTAMPQLEGLAELQKLEISENLRLEILPPINKLIALKELLILENASLQMLPPLSGLPKLQTLAVSGNMNLRTVPPLERLPALLQLVVTGRKLQLPPLDELSSLQEVRLDGPFVAAVLSSLAQIGPLKEIVLSDDSALTTGVANILSERREAGLAVPKIARLPSLMIGWRKFYAEELGPSK